MIIKKYIEMYPFHISIIMDGNGRWAKFYFLERFLGHYIGAKKSFYIIQLCLNIEIKYTTLYVFSSENWNRTYLEINNILSLLFYFFLKYYRFIKKKKIAIKLLGFISKLPICIKNFFHYILIIVINKSLLTLILAISYGGREDIFYSFKSILLFQKLYKFNINIYSKYLYQFYISTGYIINPDILIRSGKKQRLSNFFLWQSAYTEFYFLSANWPQFSILKLNIVLQQYTFCLRTFGENIH